MDAGREEGRLPDGALVRVGVGDCGGGKSYNVWFGEMAVVAAAEFNGSVASGDGGCSADEFLACEGN